LVSDKDAELWRRNLSGADVSGADVVGSVPYLSLDQPSEFSGAL
jgi:hypothetical protein